MGYYLDYPMPVYFIIGFATVWTVYYIGKQILTALAPAIRRHPYITMFLIAGAGLGFAAGNQAASMNGNPACWAQIQTTIAGLSVATILFLVCRAFLETEF